MKLKLDQGLELISKLNPLYMQQSQGLKPLYGSTKVLVNANCQYSQYDTFIRKAFVEPAARVWTC